MPDFWCLEATSQAIIWRALGDREKLESDEEWIWTFEPFSKPKTTFCKYWTLIKVKIRITCLQRVWSENKNGTAVKTVAKIKLGYNMKIVISWWGEFSWWGVSKFITYGKGFYDTTTSRNLLHQNLLQKVVSYVFVIDKVDQTKANIMNLLRWHPFTGSNLVIIIGSLPEMGTSLYCENASWFFLQFYILYVSPISKFVRLPCFWDNRKFIRKLVKFRGVCVFFFVVLFFIKI